jgi:hypothetical protein
MTIGVYGTLIKNVNRCTLKREVGPGMNTNYPRHGPGFYEESEEFHFGIHVFEHENIASWTIQHSAKKSGPIRPAQVPSKLRLVGFASDRVTLLDEVSGNEYVAPAYVLLDYLPQPKNYQQQAQKQPQARKGSLWRELPDDWAQFGVAELIPSCVLP